MKTICNDIAECLRSEIEGYGSLYRFFEEQQKRLFARDADSVLRLSGEIEAQVRELQGCRFRREEAVARFAAEYEHPGNATVRSMLPLFPAETRPLISALIGEINVLIHRVRRLSRNNFTLMARTLELQQHLLCQLLPGTFSPTYSPSGRLALAVSGVPGSLRSCG